MHHALTRFGFLLAARLPIAAFAADTLLHISAPSVRLAPPGAVATGAFMRIGNGVEADGSFAGLHTPLYDFNDKIIPAGVRYWVGLVEQELGQGWQAIAAE